MVDPLSLVARPVVNKILSLTSSFINEQYHLVYGVKHEVVRLNSKLKAIHATLSEGERIPFDARSQLLQDWLTKLKDAALDAEDVLELYATKAQSKKKHSLVISPLLRREASRNIKEITARINEICQENQNFGFREGSRPNSDTDRNCHLRRLTGPLPDTSEICGRQDEQNNILNWLLSEESNKEGEVPVLPIIGMAGLGKTSLAQFIYNDERVKDHFTNRVWIDVKRTFELDRFEREMIEGLTEMKIELTAQGTIEKRLEEEIAGKSLMLVLDDLWEVTDTDWGKLQQILRKGKTGSRVLVTSRIEEIGKTVRAHNPLCLDYLPEEDCWSLFAKKAFQGGHPPSSEIENIGKRIVCKCNGLPLAVTAMANLLYSIEDVRKWSGIEKDGIWEIEIKNAKKKGDPGYIVPALRLSYEHLPYHLQQCFTYCCIFPKSYMFDKIELVKLWIAEGFVEPEERSTLNQIGEDYFDDLRSRSFFQPLNIDNREIYRMHDLFHDLALSFSGHFVTPPGCVTHFSYQVEDDKEKFSGPRIRNSRHVSFFCEVVESSASKILEATKLRTILLPVDHSRNFGKALDKIFCTLKYLRVLDLNSTTMTELPESIGKLKLLHYLNLSHTEIRELPNSICKLINLQTLKLIGCVWLYKLPKDFNNLTNLRHLELDEMFWNKCTSSPPGMGALTNLQNFHFFRVGSDSINGIEQLQSMNCLTGKLHISDLENTATASASSLKEKENLEQLVLEWSGEDTNLQDPGVQETVLQELEPHSNLKVLQICRYRGNGLPAWMANGSIQNLSEVSLSYCVNVKILSLGPLPHIRKLHLKAMQKLEEWPEMDYPLLNWLQISKCPNLTQLPNFFPNLRVMKIKKCSALKDLPLTPSLMFLILIDNIMLENWKELVGTMVGNEGQIRLHPSYLNLLELKIEDCQRLRGLPRIFAPQKLEIRGCPLVPTLPNEDYSRRLQHLALDGCTDRTLVEAIPTTTSTYSLVLSNIATLISLPTSLNLSGLKALYIHGCGDLEFLSDNDGAPLLGFTSLMLLSVCGCPKLITFVNKGLPTSLECLSIKKCLNLKSLGPENCFVGLTLLRDLLLEDSPKIMSFPDGGVPISLKHLRLRRCPLLSQRFNDGGPYRRMLADDADLEIDST